MSANDKKSEVFSFFKEVKCECLVRSHTISMNIGLLKTSSHLCQCKSVYVWKNTRVFFVICALCMVFPDRLLAGITKTATNTSCKECKHLVIWGLSVFECSDTNVVLKTATFLILVVGNNKRSSGIDSKTSSLLSRNYLCHGYLDLRFC